MIIHPFNGKEPQIGEGTFVAETAALVGDVKVGRECSIWYSAVLRGDENSIRIGDRVSVQDCTVVHVSHTSDGNVEIGSDVIIGHNATVHGCTIGNHVLIGMGATILDGAVVGDGAMVAAHALVLGKTVIGPYELWGGVPAKFIKKVSPEAVERTIDKGVAEYAHLAAIYNDMTP
ncbi:MAG: gamma carbonic anhydrase family protein [Bacteroidales bacterium]|nr:gamma carbonic anhydrase family protein [Bacteroidales bacterium]